MPKRPDTWMPLYIGDYLRKTMHLSVEHHGAYLLLIMACWCEGGTIKNDEKKLAEICKISRTKWRNNFREILIDFFEVDEAGWHNRRVSEELVKAEEITGERRDAGRAGGLAKAKQTPSKTPSKTLAKRWQKARPSPSPSPSTLSSGSKEPSERETRAREAPGEKALSQSIEKFAIGEAEIAEAAEARASAELPPANLRVEAATFHLDPRATQTKAGWLRWALKARADLSPDPNGHDPPSVYKPDVPDGPPPPFDWTPPEDNP